MASFRADLRIYSLLLGTLEVRVKRYRETSLITSANLNPVSQHKQVQSTMSCHFGDKGLLSKQVYIVLEENVKVLHTKEFFLHKYEWTPNLCPIFEGKVNKRKK